MSREAEAAQRERRVSVPVVGDRHLHGVVLREEQDEHVGLVYVVRFPSGNEARLTPREVVFDAR